MYERESSFRDIADHIKMILMLTVPRCLAFCASRSPGACIGCFECISHTWHSRCRCRSIFELGIRDDFCVIFDVILMDFIDSACRASSFALWSFNHPLLDGIVLRFSSHAFPRFRHNIPRSCCSLFAAFLSFDPNVAAFCFWTQNIKGRSAFPRHRQ